MKGVINIEFFISVALFLSTIFFIIISIVNNMPQFHDEAFLSSLRAKTFDVSQILVLDEGSPKDWNTRPLPAINRIGLSTSKKYMVSELKINRTRDLCQTSYNTVRDILLGDPNFIIIINITNIENNQTYMYCSPTAATLVLPKSSIKRHAVLDTTGNRISIQVDVT